VILLDTSAIIAALSPAQRNHQACARALYESDPSRILSPFVLAELDYFILKYANVSTELRFLGEVTHGAYELAAFSAQDLEEAISIIQTYHDLKVGLADASIVVLANRYNCRDVLTLDERHFRTLRFRRRAFRILPADA